MQTLLWVVRHGSTTDSGKGIFRGQRDSSLDKQGFLDAHELKKFFANKTWDKIFCSDMKRACQTAIIIAGDREKDIAPPMKKFRPWDIGYITGKDKKKYSNEMETFINNPDQVPKNGESRNQFETGRIKPLDAELIIRGIKTGKPSIKVDHSSGIHALSHLINGEDGQNVAVKPGGAIEVYLENGEIKLRAVLKPGKDDSSFAAGSSS